jgi:glycosyltransferase involved in cell wall biosynthesis
VTLSIVVPFYRNAMMLAHQYAVWTGYPEARKAQIEIVLVDDGSPEPAASVARPDGLPPLRIYRVLEDRPWHQHGARNLGAREAQGPWLCLTDMDHVLPAESVERLLAVLATADPESVFMFHRLDAPRLTPTLNDRGEWKPHVNTFALTRELFWRVGGYDEDCVGYGTDSYFRRRLLADRAHTLLMDVPIVRYPREVIPDASTTEPGVDPRALRDRGRRTAETRERMNRKARLGLPPRVLDFPWERAL